MEFTADVSRFGDGIAVTINGAMTSDEKLALATRIANAVPSGYTVEYEGFSASHGFLFKVTR